METASNTLSDFIEVRSAINSIIDDKDKFVIIECNTGSLNSQDRRSSPHPIFSMRFHITFVEKDKATEDDLDKAIDIINFKAPIASMQPSTILGAINLITTDGNIQGNDNPSLVYIASQTSSSLDFKMGRTEYTAVISVDAVSAEQYDQIQRKPINSSTVQEVLKENIK